MDFPDQSGCCSSEEFGSLLGKRSDCYSRWIPQISSLVGGSSCRLFVSFDLPKNWFWLPIYGRSPARLWLLDGKDLFFSERGAGRPFRYHFSSAHKNILMETSSRQEASVRAGR